MMHNETEFIPEMKPDTGGLFTTPLGAAMLSGLIAGVLNVALWLILSSHQNRISEVLNRLGPMAFTMLYFLPTMATYSGPAIARRSVPLLAGAFFVALVYTIINTAVATVIISVLTNSTGQLKDYMATYFAINRFFSTIVVYTLLSKMYGGPWFNIWFIPIALILVFPMTSLYFISHDESRDADTLRIMAMLVLPIIHLLPQAFIIERELNARATSAQT